MEKEKRLNIIRWSERRRWQNEKKTCFRSLIIELQIEIEQTLKRWQSKFLFSFFLFLATATNERSFFKWQVFYQLLHVPTNFQKPIYLFFPLFSLSLHSFPFSLLQKDNMPLKLPTFMWQELSLGNYKMMASPTMRCIQNAFLCRRMCSSPNL